MNRFGNGHSLGMHPQPLFSPIYSTYQYPSLRVMHACRKLTQQFGTRAIEVFKIYDEWLASELFCEMDTAGRSQISLLAPAAICAGVFRTQTSALLVGVSSRKTPRT